MERHNWRLCELRTILYAQSRLPTARQRNTNFQSSDLWALRPIKPMDELLVEYATEEYLRHHVPWIECLLCIDGTLHWARICLSLYTFFSRIELQLNFHDVPYLNSKVWLSLTMNICVPIIHKTLANGMSALSHQVLLTLSMLCNMAPWWPLSSTLKRTTLIR